MYTYQQLSTTGNRDENPGTLGAVAVASCNCANWPAFHCTFLYVLNKAMDIAASSMALWWSRSGAPSHTCDIEYAYMYECEYKYMDAGHGNINIVICVYMCDMQFSLLMWCSSLTYACVYNIYTSHVHPLYLGDMILREGSVVPSQRVPHPKQRWYID